MKRILFVLLLLTFCGSLLAAPKRIKLGKSTRLVMKRDLLKAYRIKFKAPKAKPNYQTFKVTRYSLMHLNPGGVSFPAKSELSIKLQGLNVDGGQMSLAKLYFLNDNVKLRRPRYDAKFAQVTFYCHKKEFPFINELLKSDGDVFCYLIDDPARKESAAGVMGFKTR